MRTDTPKPGKYPLLEAVLTYSGQSIKGLYTLGDVASIFRVSVRAIQQRVKRGELKTRNLPGRAKCLPIDLERYLEASAVTSAIAS